MGRKFYARIVGIFALVPEPLWALRVGVYCSCMGEREPQSERLQRGELLCLYHPGTPDTFSGYGLVMESDWPGHLTGLLMVDRPTPAAPSWLEQIYSAYGECELVPMTTWGERGLVCQMYIEPDSLQHLRRFAPAFGQPLQESLQPLLNEPPAPTLSLHWDEERGVWLSQMVFTTTLPPEIREVFEHSGYGCLAAETTGGVVHVCHASDEDIAGFTDKPIQSRWELIKMPTAPLVRLEFLVFDRPFQPFRFEAFLNVGATDQLQVLNQLASQAEFHLAFYGDGLTYHFATSLPHTEQQWQQLDEVVSQAMEYWEQLPADNRDFDLAKAEYFIQST